MKILYCDEQIIVCIKPAGALSTDESGGMPELIRQTLGKDQEVYTVHRLDSIVSGLMVYALTRPAASHLSRQMAEDIFLKEYMAVVEGVPEKDTGRLKDFLKRNKQSRKTYVVKRKEKDAKEAILDYRILAKKQGLSLVRIHLITGRTHQIRAQFSSRSLPLYGDGKYGSAHGEAAIALWSCHLAFKHPETEELMDFFVLPPSGAPWDSFVGFHQAYEPSDVRIAFKRSANLGDCPYQEACGHCTYQGIDYERQLEKKRKLAGKWFKKYGDHISIQGMEQPLGYRDKAFITFGRGKNGAVIRGIYAQSGHHFVPIRRCLINHPIIESLADTLCMWMTECDIAPFDPAVGTGWLKGAMLMRNASDALMVSLIAISDVCEGLEDHIKLLIQRVPGICSVILYVNPTGKSMALSKTSQVLYGEGVMEDQVAGFCMRVSPKSFFASNHQQFERLCTLVSTYAANMSGRGLDVYCDTGMMTMLMARHCEKVFGINTNQIAMKEAMIHAKQNHLENIKWISTAPADYVHALARSHENISVALINAPYRGCDRDVIDALIHLTPRSIIYLSGNPEYAARDLEFLEKGNYSVRQIRLMDIYPYESHVESIIYCSRKKNE